MSDSLITFAPDGRITASPVQLTLSGHDVLDTFFQDDGTMDALIKTGDENKKFIIVRDFDVVTGTWVQQSCYTDLLLAAGGWSLNYRNGNKGGW